MSLDRSTRRRLSSLGRSGTPGPAPEAAPAPAPRRRLLSVGEAEEVHGTLEELLPGVIQEIEEGEYYELLTPLAEVGQWAVEAVAGWAEHARQGRFPHSSVSEAGNLGPEDVVFFDTETTGLNHTPLFLVGLLCHENGEPCLRQLLARDYAEEAPVLNASRRLLARAGLVVSYNGTTFDLPYLRNRLRYHRLPQLRLKGHLDLLHVARSRIGRAYGNCKLQTLERHMCCRQRCADIPGAEIPQAYHDFVADGDACRLKRIIEHNIYDVITLAELSGQLAVEAQQTPSQ